MMNSTTRKILTIVGTKAMEEIIKVTAKKLAKETGLKEEHWENDLTVGYKVKGNPNIFFDIMSIAKYVKRDKPLTEDDIALTVVPKSTTRSDKVKFMRVKEDDIKGTFKFNFSFIEDTIKETVFGMFKSKEKSEEEIEEKPQQKISEEVIDSDEDFNLKEKPYTAVLNTETKTIEDTTEEITEMVEEPVDPRATTKLGKFAEKGARAFNEVSNNISELAETIDKFKGKFSIKIIHETCDTDSSLTATEGEINGTHRVVKGGQGVIEILHIYKNNQYVGSYHKGDLFAVLAPMVMEKKLEITSIKHISTIRGEFIPKDKF